MRQNIRILMTASETVAHQPHRDGHREITLQKLAALAATVHAIQVQKVAVIE
jgi:hypothetical protein